jgi:4-hydroxybutyrate CoA-transferase
MSVEISRGAPLASKPKPISDPDLESLISAGSTVVIGHGGAWPKRLVTALVSRSRNPFTIIHNRIDDELPYFAPDVRERVRHVALMLSNSNRPHFADGRVGYIPNCYGQLPFMIRDGLLAVDVVLLHLSPADTDGYCSLGTCSAYLPTAAEHAAVVVGQVNPCMPTTFGTRIHLSQLDYVYQVDEALFEVPPARADDVATAIAQHVVKLVPSGATLQIGIGKLADTILGHLANRRGLRIHSETFGDAMVDLVGAGAVRLGAAEPALTATFITGTRRLYEFADRNPELQLLPVEMTNHPATIASMPSMVAVNSAVEVDLTGQVNAEAIDGRLHSGVGGHLDFAVGAGLAPGGRYIVAMPSGAAGGSRSRIVPVLGASSPVTVPRSLAGYVVTEYGVAELRGKTLDERAAALIAISHPDHRKRLRELWFNLDPALVGGHRVPR